MKRGERTGKGGFLFLAYRGLLVIALILPVLIGGVTVYALIFHTRASRPAASAGEAAGADAVKEAVFTGLGRLRIPTAGGSPAMVILAPAFPYAVEDQAFSEELATKVQKLRTITEAYFAALTVEELRAQGEEGLKAGLLARYNDALVLGKLRALYFNEYMVLE